MQVKNQPLAYQGGIITLDGLAASGKSSVAKAMAAKLGVPFVSSGLLYRAVALLVLEEKLDVQNENEIMAALASAEIKLVAKNDGNLVFIAGVERSQDCHTGKVDALVSATASHSQVRQFVNAIIRQLPQPFVAEGRDMGSVVFTDAWLKIFLTATARARAVRRASERTESVEHIEQALIARDEKDAINTQAAQDAIAIDTSNLSFEEVLEKTMALVESKVRTEPLAVHSNSQ